MLGERMRHMGVNSSQCSARHGATPQPSFAGTLRLPTSPYFLLSLPSSLLPAFSFRLLLDCL